MFSSFSLDDEQRWYRYHHLFSDLLRKRLLTSHGSAQITTASPGE